MKRLAIEHLEPYFQHRLAVQYTGILNVTELSKWDKENRDIDVFDDPETPKPEEVCGLKIGWVKHVRYYKKGIELIVGVRKPAKVFTEHNLSELKPILRPLNLTNKIKYRGEVFVPIQKLRELFRNVPNFDFHIGVWLVKYPDLTNTNIEYCVMQKLHEWHFDTQNLIGQGLAISVHDLTENPYEK